MEETEGQGDLQAGDLHGPLKSHQKGPLLIEFHLGEVLINNGAALTGLYYVHGKGDDACISRVCGSRGGWGSRIMN